MANSGRFLSILTLALMFFTLEAALAAKSTRSVDAIDCKNEAKKFAPCLDFITGKNPKPSDSCCKGVKQIDKDPKTTPEKQAVCECLKTELAKLKGLKYEKLGQINKVCATNVTLIPVTKDANCKSIKLKDLFG